jgi:hypothetical protein
MSETDLDGEYPQGSPSSPGCRWCGEARVTDGKAIYCTTCDRASS